MKMAVALAVVASAGLAFAAGRWTAVPAVALPASDEAPVPQPKRADQPTATASSTSSADEPRPLVLLKQCAERLEQTRARLRAVRTEPRDADGCSVAACLRTPGVVAACREALGVASDPNPSGTGADPGAGASAAAAGGERFARQFATNVVGTSGDDAEWLEDYLCTVHNLREGMVEELRSLLDRAAPAEVIEAAIAGGRSERAAVLDDLEQRLGASAYERLRSVGGLGILGSALQCPA